MRTRCSWGEIAKASSWFICRCLIKLGICARSDVYCSFFFTLQEFAKELISLVDAMSRICNVQRETGWRRLLRPWNYVRNRIRRLRTSSSEKRKSGLKRRFCMFCDLHRRRSLR